jgi:glucokinase
MSGALIGIEIGGTKLQVVTGGPDGRITGRRRFEVQRSGGGAGIRRQIEGALREFAANPAGIGVGFGGPVDWRTGKICCSHQIQGWAEFELGSWLRDLSKAPVRVDNDANTAALAEAVLGAGAGANPVFYVTLGSGVGGGLAVDGRIYHGAMPGESEIGHVRLDRQGTIVEERCSGWAVDRKVRAAIAAEPGGILARLVSDRSPGEARALAPALAEGDRLAGRILDETAEDLAFALSHVVHLCHPEVIVLGGGLSLTGEPLRERVQRHLDGFIMHAFAPGPRVRLAALGEDVVPAGALLLARDAAGLTS